MTGVATRCLMSVLACLAIVGCAPVQAPSQVTASVYQVCSVDPDTWQERSTPTEREALLEVKDKKSGEPIRKHFITPQNRMESWFENSSRDLLACRYIKREDCGGGVVSIAIFRRDGVSWDAEPTFSRICTD